MASEITPEYLATHNFAPLLDTIYTKMNKYKIEY